MSTKKNAFAYGSCTVACFGLAGLVLILGAQPVAAQFYVRSPDVEKGVLKLEEHGAVYSGRGEDERRRQSHELEAKYGFTDRWEGIVEATFRQDIGEDFEANRIELGAQYEIVERHGDGWGLAFRSLYEFRAPERRSRRNPVWADRKICQGTRLGDGERVLYRPGRRSTGTSIVSSFKFNWRLKHEFNDMWGPRCRGL